MEYAGRGGPEPLTGWQPTRHHPGRLWQRGEVRDAERQRADAEQHATERDRSRRSRFVLPERLDRDVHDHRGDDERELLEKSEPGASELRIAHDARQP